VAGGTYHPIGRKENKMSEFQVMVWEGTDIATFYTKEKPEVIDDNGVKLLRFIPRNGIVNRVGRINDVPFERVIAIVSEIE
jgi:hypothetical protein